MSENIKEKIILEASDKAFHAFGFSYIFENRIKWYLKSINALKFSGIIVPLIIGSIALSYTQNPDVLIIAIIIGTPIIIIQLIISALSIVYKWDDELAYAFEANNDYNTLYDEYTILYKFPDLEITELERKYDVLLAKSKARELQNSKHKLSEKELRKGMRYSLREHKKECIGCKQTPIGMTSTICEVCGNF
jgi:mobilome CxxCx(11)CxxC protein